MRDGPLDMRMDQGSEQGGGGAGGTLTASEIVNEWTAPAIADVLWSYGEERESRRLARAIVAARPLHSTSELVAVLSRAGSKKQPKEVTSPCTSP